MPKPESHSSVNNDELQGASGVSDVTKDATERSRGENAYHSIDSYILEVWQEPPPSPAARQNPDASIISVDSAGDDASSAVLAFDIC